MTRSKMRRAIAGFTAFSLFWTSVLPAQTLVLPDGRTGTQVTPSGTVHEVTTTTVQGDNAFNSFSRFEVAPSDTVNLVLPNGTHHLLNLVHDARTTIDGVVNARAAGQLGGNLYFADSHGFIVGAQGVVNASALQVITPTQAFMDDFFATGPDAAKTAQILNGTAPLNPAASIEIHGTVNATDAVALTAGSISISGKVATTGPTVPDVADAINLGDLARPVDVTVDAGGIALHAVDDVTVQGDLLAKGAASLAGGRVLIDAGGDVALDNGAEIDVSGTGTTAHGGSLAVRAGESLSLKTGAALRARGGNVSGDGGRIELRAAAAPGLDGGTLDAGATSGARGTVALGAETFAVSSTFDPWGGADLTASTAAHLEIFGTTAISLTGTTLSTRVTGAGTTSLANSGNLVLRAPTITLTGGASLDTSANGAFHAGSLGLTAPTITMTESDLDARASTGNPGAVTLTAFDDTFLDHPFGGSTTTGITLTGAVIHGGSITLHATAETGYTLDPSTEELADEGYWDLDGIGEDAVHFVSEVRPFIWASIAKATAGITLQGGVRHTVIDAAGSLDIAAAASARAGLSTYGIGASIGYGRAEANAHVHLLDGSEIAADNALTVKSSIRHEVEVAGKVFDASKQSKVPLDTVVAVTDARGEASTRVASGAVVTGRSATEKVTLKSYSNKDLSTEVEAGAGSDLLGVAVAVSQSDTRATTEITGAVTAAGNLVIDATAETDGNATSADTTIGDSFFEEWTERGGQGDVDAGKYAHMSKAGFIQALLEKFTGSLASGTEPKKETGTTSKFIRDNGLSAAVVVADHRNQATATIGGGADVAAIGDLDLLATTTGAQRLSATSETSQSDDDPAPKPKAGATPPAGDGAKKNAASAAVIIGNFDNVATATIAGQQVGGVTKFAQVDAGGTLTVEAKAREPIEISPPLFEALREDTFEISSWLEALPGSDLDIPDTFFSAWAQSAAEATNIGIAGSVTLFDIDNVTGAGIGAFAKINQDEDFLDDLPVAARVRDVEVRASSEASTLKLAGLANFVLDVLTEKGAKLFTTGGDKAGIGGSILATFYDQTTDAWIDDGALVDARDLAVVANTDTLDISLAVAGNKAGKYGFAGSASSVDVVSHTTARVDDGATLAVDRDLSVIASDDTLAVNAAGGIGQGKSVGFGAGVAINDFERTTQALIGNVPEVAGQVTDSDGAIDAGGRIVVDASNGGAIWTAALAAAVKADDKDVPAPDSTPAPSASVTAVPADPLDKPPTDTLKTKASRDTGKGGGGLHISADVAVSEIDDLTRAYLNGASSVQAGAARTPGASDAPSLVVSASNDSSVWSLAGAVTVDTTKSGGSGTEARLAGSFALNSLGGTTEAFIADGDADPDTGAVTATGNVALSATRGGGIRALTASGSGSTQKSGLNIAGSVSLNDIANTTKAYTDGAQVTVETAGAQPGSLELKALDTSDIYAIAGAVTFGGKAGFGATVTVNDIGNVTEAYGLKSHLDTTGALAILARNANEIWTVGGSLGLSSNFSFSGVGLGNTIHNTARASLVNTATLFRTPDDETDFGLYADGDVSVIAEDDSLIEALAIGAAGATKGAGVGASVAVNTVTNTVEAQAANVVFEQPGATFALAARSMNRPAPGSPDSSPGERGIRALAGALGIGKDGGAGVSVAVNRLGSATTATLGGADSRIHARNVTVDANGDGRISALAVGLGAGGTVGVAGSVVTNHVNNQTTARIDGGAQVVAEHNVAVRAETDDRITVGAGSVAIGVKGAGVGAAVTVNSIGSTTTAEIGRAATDGGTRAHVVAKALDAADRATVRSGTLGGDVDLANGVDIAHYARTDLKALKTDKQVSGLAVNASATQHLESIDANIAAGAGLGAGAAVNVNVVDGATVARVVNSDINQAADATGTPGAAQVVDVTAGNHAYGNGFVGAVSAGGSALGAAVDTHVLSRTTRAAVVDSVLDAAGTLGITAESSTGASSLAAGGSGGGFALAGTAAVAKFNGLTEAYALRSALTADAVAVAANAVDRMYLVSAAVAIGGSMGGAGTFGIGIGDSITRAYLAGSPDNRAAIRAADGVSVTAHHLMDINAYAAGAAGAGGAGIAGSVAVNLSTNQVEAYVRDAELGTDDAAIGFLTIDARGDAVFDNVAGALGVGITGTGIGAGASVNVLKSAVTAKLADSTVVAAKDEDEDRSGDVRVTALSTNEIKGRAITLGAGGSVGIGGAAVVTVLGVSPDATANAEVGGTLTQADSVTRADRLSETGSQDTVAMSAEERTAVDDAAAHDLSGSVGGDAAYATQALVEGSRVDANSMTVEARDRSLATSLSGAVGLGTGLGFGGGVGVTLMRANLTASIDAASVIEVDGSLTVRAKAAPLGDGKDNAAQIDAYAGGGGLVGLGAAVAYGRVDNAVTARLAGDVLAADLVLVEAEDDTDLRLNAIGNAIGAVAVGVSYADGEKRGTTLAETADGSADPSAETGRSLQRVDVIADGLTITARGSGTVNADVIAAAGGLAAAGSGADANAKDDSTVSARVGQHTRLALGNGALRVEATSQPEVLARALGVAVSLGAGVGVSLADAVANTHTNAIIADAARVTAGALTVSALQQRNGAALTAYSDASGSAGGLLFGVNASSSDAATTTHTQAAILSDTLLDIAGDVLVQANADGIADARVSGLSVGFAAIGANFAKATSGSETTARVAAVRRDGASGTSWPTSIDGDLTVTAIGRDGTFAGAVAGAGGVVAGAAAGATTDNRSTTTATVAASPAVAGRLAVRAEHHATFNAEVSTLSAAIAGASGGRAENDVNATVTAQIGDAAALRAGGFGLLARNTAIKNGSGFDLESGAGGFLGGAAARSETDVVLNTEALIGRDAVVRVDAPAALAGGVDIAAVNEFVINDRVRLDAGGAIAIARAESDVYADVLARSSLAEGALLDTLTDVNLAAGNRGTTFASANAKTYGLAGAAEGHSWSTIVADSLVDIAPLARIRADGDVVIAAGRNDIGAADELGAVARTDLYNKTVFPVETAPDADAVVRHASRIDVQAGGRVNSVEDIALIADRGNAWAEGRGIGKDLYRAALAAFLSFFSNLFGGGDVVLDIVSGTSAVANTSQVRIDGEVAAGIQYRQRLVIARDGSYTERSEGVTLPVLEADVDIVARMRAELDEYMALAAAYQSNPAAAAAYENEADRLRQQLRTLGLTANPDDDGNDGLTPVREEAGKASITADFLTIAGVRARGGDIAVEAGSLVGTGTLHAPGNASISILNASAAYMKVGDLVIEDGGGRLTLNGATVRSNADIARRNVAGAGTAAFVFPATGGATEPLIEVITSYVAEAGPNGEPGRSPDIEITGDLTNTLGTIRVHNLRGGVLVKGDTGESGPRITADTVDVDAGGDFVQSYVERLYNIGGNANDPRGLQMWGTQAATNMADTSLDAMQLAGVKAGTGSIIAGNNVFISARTLNINGTIQSGIADWSLTLDAAAKALIDDYEEALTAGGDEARIGAEKLQLSAFVGDPRGTIAAFYNPESRQIELEGVRVQGGYLQLFGDIINTGGGQLKVLDGYGRIDITNETDLELVVNSLDTGTSVAGQLQITDTSQKIDHDGNEYFLTTRYLREGGQVHRQKIAIVNGDRIVKDDEALDLVSGVEAGREGRFATHELPTGKRFVWNLGKDETRRKIYSATRSTVFGIKYAQGESYTSERLDPPGTDPVPFTELPGGEYTVVDPDDSSGYRYTHEEVDTLGGEQFAGRSTWTTCDFWFFGCIAKTYHLEDTFIIGQRDVYTHSVRADHPIGIEFIGEDVGSINVTSDATLHLRGLVNDRVGSVALTSTTGAIDAVSQYAGIRAATIDLNAYTGIGTASAPVVTEASEAVRAVTDSGDVALRTSSGDLNVAHVATGDGRAWLAADGNLRGVGAASVHVAARRIELASAFGAIGSTDTPLRIAVGAAGDGVTGGLAAEAFGSLFITQPTGDLVLDRVVSLTGDVTLTVEAGNFVDGNTHAERDARSSTEQDALWRDLGLVNTGAEDAADASLAKTREALKRRKETEYAQYWQYRGIREVTDDAGNVIDYTANPYDDGRYVLTVQEENYLRDSLDFDDAAVADYVGSRTAEYRRLHEMFGSTSYDPHFEYALTATDVRDTAAGYAWTTDELRYALNEAVFDRVTTDTETSVEEANVRGRRVSLVARAGSVGTDAEEVVLDANKGDGADPVKRAILANAEVDDVVLDLENGLVRILQREDIDVEASEGLAVEARARVYLGGERDLNVSSVKADGTIRIKGAQGVFDVNDGSTPAIAGSGLIVEAANGDIGRADAPLTVVLGGGSLRARAGGSLYVEEQQGDLRIAEANARGRAELAAAGDILDTRGVAAVALRADSARLVARTGDIGATDAPFHLHVTGPGGLAASADDIYLTAPLGALTLGGVDAQDEVRILGIDSLFGRGTGPHVTGGEIVLEALHGTIGAPETFLSVDSRAGVTALADTGLWLEEWAGNLFARRIHTRTGPLAIRVRDGNALFDDLVSPEQLKLDLAGGSLSVRLMEAPSVDLRLREPGARLRVDDLRVRDSVLAWADFVDLPRVTHLGAADSLGFDVRGHAGGLATRAWLDVTSASPVRFAPLYADWAHVTTSGADLRFDGAQIGEHAEFRSTNPLVIVENVLRERVPSIAQLYAPGRFSLAMEDPRRLVTDALLVDYDDALIVNAFDTENSVLRQTRKVLAVGESSIRQWRAGMFMMPQPAPTQPVLELGAVALDGWWSPDTAGEFSVEP